MLTAAGAAGLWMDYASAPVESTRAAITPCA